MSEIQMEDLSHPYENVKNQSPQSKHSSTRTSTTAPNSEHEYQPRFQIDSQSLQSEQQHQQQQQNQISEIQMEDTSHPYENVTKQ